MKDLGFSYQAELGRTYNSETNQDCIHFRDIVFPPRKVFVQIYGCQMNISDSERLLSHLQNFNFEQTKELEEADLVFFNTCAVRDHANQKFYSHLSELVNRKKEQNLDLKIGIAGCVAQVEGKELQQKHGPALDFVMGTEQIDKMPDILESLYGKGQAVLHTQFKKKEEEFSQFTQITHGSPQAFVTIMKGCNNFCSYCIVPYTRGREKSRLLKEIVEDVKFLVSEKGIQEVTLLGQNVNSFGKENGESFAQLLTDLNAIEGLKILRYTTSHPYDMSDELIEAHGRLDKLSNHLHLPVQSGSSSTLERMNRKYTSEHYLNLVQKLRKVNPDLVLSSDIIAGFPNETEKEHQETLELLKKVRFDFIYAYAFSRRPLTKAFDMEDSLEDKTRHERLLEIQNLQLELQKTDRQNMVGKTYTVLVEGKGKLKSRPNNYKGRANNMRIVHFDYVGEQDILWNWIDVKVTSATALSAQGEILKIHGCRLESASYFK